MNFLAKSNGKRGEIYIYDAIGAGFFGDGVSAKSFAESMKALGAVRALDIYVNSPGGSVFDGVAIYNQIRRFEGEKVVHIDGIAASIASVIALAGDERRIAANGTVMIHNPYGITAGGADDMRKYADSLDKIRDTIVQTYADRTGGNAKQLQEWMDAETWMDASEAVERGFATAITEDKAIKAEFPMLAKFNNVPDRLLAQATGSNSLLSRMSMRVQSMNLRASPGAA